MSRTRTNILRTTTWMIIFASCVTHLFGQDTTTAPFGEISADTVVTADTIRLTNPMIPSAGVLDRSGIHSSIIADSAISFMDYRSLYDIIGALPGVILNDPGSPGQFAGISIDGGDAFSTMFYADGVPLNDPITGQFDLHLYPVENIERIEIIRGPMAAGFGSGAAGSAINFVSKNKSALTPYSHIRYSESGHGYSYFDGMASQDVFRRFNVTLGVGHQTTLGRFTNSDFDLWSGRAKLRYTIDHRLNLFASMMYTKSQRGLNGGIDLAATPDPELRFDGQRAIVVNGDAYEKNSRYDLQVGGLGRFFEDTLNVTTMTMFLTTNLREYRDEENRSGSNGIFLSQNHQSLTRGILFNQHFESGILKLDAGSTIQTLGSLSSDNYGRILRTRFDIHAGGTIHLSEHNEVSAFIRHHRQSDLPYRELSYNGYSPISYGTEFAINSRTHWRIHLGFSGVSRLTSLLESQSGSDSVWYSGSIPVQNYFCAEVGITSPLLSENGFDFRIFTQAYDKLISPYPHIRGITEMPGMRLTTHEFGISGSGRARFGVISFSYSVLAKNVDDDYGRFSPELSGNASIYFRDNLFNDHLDLKTGFKVTGLSTYTGLRYVGKQPLFVPHLPFEPADIPDEIQGGATVDFILIGHIGKAYVHFIWENLLDRKYITTYYYPMPERNIRFGISWEFEN